MINYLLKEKKKKSNSNKSEWNMDKNFLSKPI